MTDTDLRTTAPVTSSPQPPAAGATHGATDLTEERLREVDALVDRATAAARDFRALDQEQVDAIVGAMVRAGIRACGELAWDAAPGASVLCLPHPSGASTWLNDGARVELWRRGIELLRDRWAALQA